MSRFYCFRQKFSEFPAQFWKKNSVLVGLFCFGLFFGSEVLAEDDFEFQFSGEVEDFQEIEGFEVFPDVDYDHPNWVAIHTLKSLGIFEGYPDGSFGPDRPLNRAELMAILARPILDSPEAKEELVKMGLNEESLVNCFPDVGTQWYAYYVCFAKEIGWIEGYPDGNFRPGNFVVKAEAIKMILETYNLPLLAGNQQIYNDVPLNEWYADYVFTAKEYELLEEGGAVYGAGNYITRGQVAENLARVFRWAGENL